jgi:hypothetical protein
MPIDSDFVDIIRNLQKRVKTLEERQLSTVNGVLSIGADGKIQLDGTTPKQIMKDDTGTVRVVLGYLPGKF